MRHSALILLKPDAFERRLWGTIMEFLQEHTDFVISESRLYHPSIPTTLKLGKHYAEHQGKDFFDGLMEFMVSGKILALAGRTHDVFILKSNVAPIRVKHAEGGPKNLIHCSDSPESAQREIDIWFPSA